MHIYIYICEYEFIYVHFTSEILLTFQGKLETPICMYVVVTYTAKLELLQYFFSLSRLFTDFFELPNYFARFVKQVYRANLVLWIISTRIVSSIGGCRIFWSAVLLNFDLWNISATWHKQSKNFLNLTSQLASVFHYFLGNSYN